MKTIRIIALAFTAMLMVSCSGGGGKFEGEWKPIKSHFGDKFVIKKTANAYKLTKDDKEDDSFLFLYEGYSVCRGRTGRNYRHRIQRKNQNHQNETSWRWRLGRTSHRNGKNKVTL
jgi:hypothetical protein